MTNRKLQAGKDFPTIQAQTTGGAAVTLGQPAEGCDWQMVVVYRGRHCPICTRYLNQLEGYRDRLRDIGIDLVAVSADSEAQLAQHREKLNVGFPIYHGLSEAAMAALGLYVSVPRSEKETDHNFAEPGLFVINDKGQLHVTDIANGPFARPELDTLVGGLEWIRNPENNYPIRGTAEY